MKKSKAPRRISAHRDFEFTPPYPLPTATLCAGLSRFLAENFEGSYTLENRAGLGRDVVVSPMLFAYFLRTLFSEIYGKACLDILLEEEEERIVITLGFPEELLPPRIMPDLCIRAMSAGMTLERIEGGLRAGIRTKECTVLRLYAPRENVIYDALHRLFFKRAPSALL